MQRQNINELKKEILKYKMEVKIILDKSTEVSKSIDIKQHTNYNLFCTYLETKIFHVFILFYVR